MARPLLDVHVRSKHFGARRVLQDLRLQLVAGEIVTLVGASGCGKSTLLRIAAGLDTDYRGSVRLDGRALGEPAREVGFIAQAPNLFPWCSVSENVSFELGSRGRDHARVAPLLAEVGLAGYEAVLPEQLAGGQAQRVALARSLFRQPRVLLLDEPFSAVEVSARPPLQDLLSNVVQRHGLAALLVTRDVEEAAILSDRVLVLDADPGTLREEIPVGLPRPRRRDGDAIDAARRQVAQALHAIHAV